jgi:hypothetical protein
MLTFERERIQTSKLEEVKMAERQQPTENIHSLTENMHRK